MRIICILVIIGLIVTLVVATREISRLRTANALLGDTAKQRNEDLSDCSYRLLDAQKKISRMELRCPALYR